MKKVMSVVAIALMMAGTVAYACDGCGCSAKKAEKKAECSSSSCSTNKCTKGAEKKECTKDKDAKKKCCGKEACKKGEKSE